MKFDNCYIDLWVRHALQQPIILLELRNAFPMRMRSFIFSWLIMVSDNRDETRRDCFDLCGEQKLKTGQDGKRDGTEWNGTERDGKKNSKQVVETGLNGKFQLGRFLRRDGTVKFNGTFSTTGRHGEYIFFAIGWDGKCNFSRRDGTV